MCFLILFAVLLFFSLILAVFVRVSLSVCVFLPGADIFAAAGVAVVRDVVQRLEQGTGQDHRPVQQPSGTPV